MDLVPTVVMRGTLEGGFPKPVDVSPAYRSSEDLEKTTRSGVRSTSTVVLFRSLDFGRRLQVCMRPTFSVVFGKKVEIQCPRPRPQGNTTQTERGTSPLSGFFRLEPLFRVPQTSRMTEKRGTTFLSKSRWTLTPGVGSLWVSTVGTLTKSVWRLVS